MPQLSFTVSVREMDGFVVDLQEKFQVFFFIVLMYFVSDEFSVTCDT